MRDELEMWVIYKQPHDYPRDYVARRWLIKAGVSDAIATPATLCAATLSELRTTMREFGLVRLVRDALDDPKIVEIWL